MNDRSSYFTMFLKRLLLILFISSLTLTFTFAQSVNHQIYNIPSSGYTALLSEHLNLLYNPDKREREEQLIILRETSEKSIREGDSIFIYKVLGDFVIGVNTPDLIQTDSKYRADLEDLKEYVLGYLIDQVEDDDNSISNREYLISRLALVAQNESLHDFDMNESAIEALIQQLDEDNFILKQAAIDGLKPITLMVGKRWSRSQSKAARAISSEIDSDNIELKRIYLNEVFDMLEKATEWNDGTRVSWEYLISAIEDIESPALITSTKISAENIYKIQSGALFEKYIEKLKDEIEDLEIDARLIREPISELIEIFVESDDPEEVEQAINTLVSEAKKDRAILNTIYAKISGITSFPEISEYKLRLRNQALITITTNANSSLYFFRTAMTFLGEISVFRNTHYAYIPVAMLGELLKTTDYEGLTVPTIQEIKISLDSNLPIWVGNRLINLIFIQANDSPNENVASYAVKSLSEIAQDAKNAALRWEAAKKIRFLANTAQTKSVREFALNWK